MAAKIERVGANHPDVCQGNTGKGPCEYRQVPGSPFCSIHGAGNSVGNTARRDLRNLRLNSTFGQRAGELASSTGVKTLTDEIALMRVTLETVFNGIKDGNEMLLYVDKIEKLTKGIQSLVESWQKIQEKNKELLDRTTVTAIWDQLIGLIVDKVEDPDVVRAIAEEGMEIISKATGG